MKPLAALQDMHFTNNIFYFVMEFASGGTLVDYVRKQVGDQTSLLLSFVSGNPPRAGFLMGFRPGSASARTACYRAALGLSLVAAVLSCRRWAA